MRRRAAITAVLWSALAATGLAARAQPDPDPIGALLDHPAEPDEPDTAGQPPAPEPVISVPPGAAQTPPPRRPMLTAPVHVEETGKTPDAPRGARDLAYDSRIRSSFASAQGFQGPLDGGWALTAQAGGDLYALQLVDRADRLEGVWRDVRRKGALSASGLVDDIQRAGSELTLRFTPAPGGPAVVATLRGGQDGRWTGDLAEGGATRAVILRRTGP